MSYVNKKTRVFKEAGDIEIHRKRSDGRMKTYTSATDARAWCDSTEDRRQHILDLIRQGDGKGLSLGKYIPIEAIIDILLSNKNNDIKRLQKEIEELKKFIRENGLKYEEKPVSIIEPVRSAGPQEAAEPVHSRRKREIDGGAGVPPTPSDVSGPGAKTSQQATPEEVKEAEIVATDIGAKRTGLSTAASAEGKSEGGPEIADEAASVAEKKSIISEKKSGISEKKSVRTAQEPDVESMRTGGTGAGADAGSVHTGGKGAGADSGSVHTGGAGAGADAGSVHTGGTGAGAETGSTHTGGAGAGSVHSGRAGAIADAGSVHTGGPGAGADTGSVRSRPGAVEDELKATTVYKTQDRKPLEDSTDPGDTTSPPFVSDSSDYDTTTSESPRYRPISKEDEKAAAALLAGKSPEDQLLALKQALADAEAFSNSEHALAVKAIQQLENIKDIVDGGDGMQQAFAKTGKASSGGGSGRAVDDGIDSCKNEIEALEREIEAMKSSSSPGADIIQREVQVLKKYCAKLAAIQNENADLKRERDMLKGGLSSTADDALKAKLTKLDEVTQERDRLRARVQQLEQELSGYGNLPQEVDSFRQKTQALDGLRDDESDLRRRLDNLEGLEDEVRKLRDRAATTAQSAGDSGDRDKLLARIAELERESDNCKCKLKEIEILTVERNCLKMRLEDLARIQRDYEDLLRKTQGFDALKAECAMYKAKYEELKNLEAECNELRAKVQKVEELEGERQLLVKEIEDCECCMNNQEDEIKRLACHIDCLTQDLDKRQDEMKVKVLTMRAHIEKKDCLIVKSEQKLADVQDQLRNSIEHLSCETTCLRNRIEELENEASAQAKALSTLGETKRMLEEDNKALQVKNKSLLESLEQEKSNKVTLEEALRKSIKSDEHLKQMLKQAKCAICCITQKLGKHEIIGSGRLEAERENYLKKIKELEEGMTEQACGAERIAELEEELMKANATIKCLRDSLETLKGLEEENKALRLLSTQLQEAAKSQVTRLEDTNENLSRKSQEMAEMVSDVTQSLSEKDKIIEDLRKELLALKAQLDKVKKRAEDAENALGAMSGTSDGDSAELNKLRAQMNILNAEIDRLNFDLENQKIECDETIKRLKAKMELLEADAQRIKELEDANNDLMTDVERYKKENELLRGELGKLRDKGDAPSDLPFKDSTLENENKTLKDEINKLKQESKNLQDEINKLKQELAAKETLEQENKNLKEEINKLKQELASKEAREQDLQNQISKLGKDSGGKEADEKDKNTILEKENKDLKDEINKLKQDLSSKSVLEKENKDLKDELNKLKQELAALKNEVSTKGVLENENKDLKDELNKLKQELAAKSAPKEDDNKFAKERDDLLKQIAAQKKEIADLLDKIKQPAKSEDTTTFKELEHKNKENEKLQKTIADLEKQLKDLQKAQLDVPKPSPEIEKTINDLQKSLEKEEKRGRDLEESLRKCQDSNEDLKKKNSELEEALQKCRENNEGLKKRVAQVEGQLEQAKEKEVLQPTGDESERVKALQDELAKRKQECNDMIASLKEQYDRDIKNLQKQNEAAIDKLQKAQQEAMNKLNEEHEGENLKLKQELRRSESMLNKLNEQKDIIAKAEPIKEDVPAEAEKEEEPEKEKDAQAVEPEESEEEPPKVEIKEEEIKPEKSFKVETTKQPPPKEKPKKEKLPKEEVKKVKPVKEVPKKEEPPEKKIKEPETAKDAEGETLPKPEEKKEEPVKEEKKKRLSIKTFDDVCICGKMPTVIPIAPVALDKKTAAEPCQAPCAYPPQYFMPQQPTPPSLPPCITSPPCIPSAVRQPTITYGAILPPEKEDKITSIKKIVELENRLLVKQQHTKQKIDVLQNTVDKFKRELEQERQKNSDLVSRYTNQSKTVANMKVEIELVKRENFQDKKKLQHLNSMTLKNIMEGASARPCTCIRPAPTPRLPTGIPHFHTELTLVKEDDNRYKHNCVLKRGSCMCTAGDKSSDSFEIGPRSSSESSLSSHAENAKRLPAFAKKIVNKSVATEAETDERENFQKELEAVNHECSFYKTKYVQMEAANGANARRVQELEAERQMLFKELEDYEGVVGRQQNKIKRLTYHMASLPPDFEKREKKVQLSTTRGSGPRMLQKRDTTLEERIETLEITLTAQSVNNQALLEKLNLEVRSKDKIKEAINKITSNYLELLNKTSRNESMCECEKYLPKLKQLENELVAKNQKVEELENERNILHKEMKHCEDYISNQVEEMKRLASYIDCLSRDSEKRQLQRKLMISTITNNIGDNDGKHELQLSKQIEELETRLNKYKTKLVTKEESNRALQAKLECEKKLRQKLEEAFTKTTQIYDDLLKQNQRYEVLKSECEMYKVKCKDYDELKLKANQVDHLAEENGRIVKENEDCNCCIQEQDQKIKELTYDIERIIQTHNEQEDQTKSTRLNLEAQVTEYKQKLKNAQEELQQCLQGFACEQMCMSNCINALETQIGDYESTMVLKDENSKALLQTIEKEKATKAKLEAALKTIIKSDKGLKQMLTQAQNTIKCITQKLKEYDIERLETQRDNQVKITELESELMTANATVTKLQENLDQMKGLMDKNVALRTFSAQLHESANIQVTQLRATNEDLSKRSQKMVEMYNYLKQVLYEKDKTFDELRNQLLTLNQQLDNEQKLREDTETILADVEAVGDSEINELQNVILVQGAEINRLYLQLDDIMKNTTVGTLKLQVKELEAENTYLKDEIEKCVAYVEALLPGYIDPAELAKLRSQLSELNAEISRQKVEVEHYEKKRVETVLHLQSKLDQEKENSKKIQQLTVENANLKKGKVSNLRTVIFMEKESKTSKYRYLYGIGGEQKNLEDSNLTPFGLKFDPKNVSEDNFEDENVVVGNENIEVTKGRTKRAISPKKEIALAGKSRVKSLKDDQKKLEDNNIHLKDGERYFEENETSPKRSKISIESKDRFEKLDTPKKEVAARLRVKNQSLDKEKKLDQESYSEVRTPKLRNFEGNDNLIEESKHLKYSKEHLDRMSVPNKEDTNIKAENRNLKRENQNLKNENKSLQEENQNLKKENKKLNEETIYLRNEANNLEVGMHKPTSTLPKMESFTNERNALTEQIRIQKKEIAELLDKIKEPQLQDDTLKELDSKERENKILKSMVADLEERLKNTAKVPMELPRGSNEVEKTMKLLQLSLDTEQKRVNDLENLWRNCESNEERLKTRIAELEDEKKKMKHELRLLRGRARIPSTSELYVTQLHKVDSNLKSWQDQINAAVVNVKNEIKAITNNMQGSTTDLSEENVAKLLREINTFKKELVENVISKKKVALTRDVQDKHISELEKQLRESQDIREQMQDELDNLHTTMDMLKNDITVKLSRPAEKTVHDAQVKQLQQQLLDSERQKDNMKRDLDNLRGRSLSVVSDMSLLDRDLEPSDSQRVKELEALLRASQAEVENLKQNTPLRATESKLSLRNGDKDKRVKELEDRLQKWQRDYDTEVGRLKRDMERMTRRGSASQGLQETEALEKIIRELETNVSNYQHLNEVLEQRNHQLEVENERVTNWADKDKKKEDYDSSIDSELEEKRIRELVEHLRELQKRTEVLKTRTIQLEVENGRLKKDLERLIGQEHKSFEKELQRLRDLEKQLKQCHDKYQHLRKRTIKTEIENKNLKKEYMDTLIAKEKISLLSREQEKTVRETNKLLRKTQDKKHSLTMRLIQFQVDNENLKKQLDSLIGKEFEELRRNYQTSNESLKLRTAHLKEENDHLKEILKNLGINEDEIETKITTEAHTIDSQLQKPKESDSLQIKIFQLEMENENMKKTLAGMKGNDSMDDLSDKQPNIEAFVDEKHLKLRAVELEIENEYLKNELLNKEKIVVETDDAEKHIIELEETVQQLTEANENLKMKNVELELDNEYVKKEIERIVRLQQTLHNDLPEKDVEKQNHNLKMRNDHLEIENKNLRKQIESLGRAQISLDVHVQEKRLKYIERILAEYQNNPLASSQDLKKSKGKDELDHVEDRLQQWKNQIQPEILDLKRDLDKLMGRAKSESHLTLLQFDDQLRDCKEKMERLETENTNLKIERDVLRKGRGSMTNLKITKEVEHQIQEFQKTESQRRTSVSDDRRVKELEERLRECKNTNDLLREEKVSLDSHVQDQRIRELEAQIRDYQVFDSKTDIGKPRKEKKSIIIDVQEMRVKELEGQLRDSLDRKDVFKKELERLRKENFILNTDLRMKLQEYEKNNEELKVEVERLQRINDLQQKLSTDLDQQLRECRAHNDSMKTKLEKLPKERKVSFQQVDYEKKIAECETDNQNLRDLLDQLRHENQEQERHIKELTEELLKCRNINKHLKLQIAQLRNENPLVEDQEKESKDEEQSQNDQEEKQPSSHDNEDNRVSEREIQVEETRKEDNLRNLGTLEKQVHESQSNTEFKRALKKLHDQNLSLQKNLEELKVDDRLHEFGSYYTSTQIELEKLRGELASKETLQQENKDLKDQINELTKQLSSAEEDNKNLKEVINNLTQASENQKREISDLRNKIQLLGGGEDNAVFLELENKNTENEKLKLVCTDLERELAQLSKFQSEVGKGDMEQKRSRKLEETLQKYHDNNECLKAKITSLENEKDNLKMELNTRIEQQNISPGSESQIRQIRKLEQIVQRYQDNNKSLKKKIEYFEADSKEKRVGDLEKQVQTYQVSNESLKRVTVQLEEEIKCLKIELEAFIEKEKNTFDCTTNEQPQKLESHESGSKEPAVDQQNSMFKIVNNLHSTSAGQEFILQQQPLIVGTVQNVLQTGYPTIPVFLQSPVISCRHYIPPQSVATIESKVNTDELQQISYLVDKIEYTLNKSRQVLESTKEEKSTAKGHPHRNADVRNGKKEKEKKSSDFKTCKNPQMEFSHTKSNTGAPGSASIDNILLKQQHIKEKIQTLRNTINKTMQEVEKESKKEKCFVRKRKSTLVAKEDNKNKTSLPSSTVGQQKFKNVTSKCSTGVGPKLVPHTYAGPSTEKKEEKQSTLNSFTRRQSTQYRTGRNSKGVNSLKK